MTIGPTTAYAFSNKGNIIRLIRTSRKSMDEFRHQWMLVLYKDGAPIKYKGFTMKSSALRVLEEWKEEY